MKAKSLQKNSPLSMLRSGITGKVISYMMIILMMFQMNSCHYYKAIELNEPPTETILDPAYGNYYMMHIGENVWQMKDMDFTEESIIATLHPVSGHQYYLSTNYKGATRYKQNSKLYQKEVLNEVHIYAKGYTEIDSSVVNIPIKNIESIIIYDRATGAEIGSWVLGIMAGYTVVMAIAFLIFLATSCPFIYVYDGVQYTMAGEIYSGAIYPAVERNDYLALNALKADEESYKLVMANELKEIQHTNFVELLYVDHPKEMDVLFDKYGQIQHISNPITEGEIKNLKGADVKQKLQTKDSLWYVGADLSNDPDVLDGLIIESNLPENQDAVKLLIRAKNSFWLEYVYKEFHELLGSKYKDYTDAKSKLSKNELLTQMLEQHLPISVYIEKNGKWIFSDYYNMVGPMAFKDDVLSIDVSELEPGPIRIKLEYGTHFWEIDYLAIDYSKNIDLDVGRISMSSALDEKENDVSALLMADDDQYYIQPEIGNLAKIEFPVPELNNAERSIFLHSKGHYRIVRDSQSKPAEMKKLKSMKEGDGLSQYSLELLLQEQEED